MGPAGFFIDANLLVLLVVGSIDERIIARHRRLLDYTPTDYYNLLALLGRVNRIFVTPNTLTEVSNLLRQHREPEHSRLMARFSILINDSDEIVIASAQAAANPHFAQLGLTDAALLESISPQTPLLTVDQDLYVAALEKEESAAVDFRQFMAPSA